MRKPAKKPQRKRGENDPEEYARFLEAAREAEASDNPDDFDKAFKMISPPSKE